MNKNNVCLAPYNIQSPSFPENHGPTFVDNTKTRLVAIISDCNTENPPEADAVILHKTEDCENGGMIKWYECPSTKGRTYTIETTGCDVYVTSFENGFLKNNGVDAREFGSRSFCFGKVYSNSDQVFETGNPCATSFTFDGHMFTVQGSVSESSDLFNCGVCWPEKIEQQELALLNSGVDGTVSLMSHEGPAPPGFGFTTARIELGPCPDDASFSGGSSAPVWPARWRFQGGPWIDNGQHATIVPGLYFSGIEFELPFADGFFSSAPYRLLGSRPTVRAPIFPPEGLNLGNGEIVPIFVEPGGTCSSPSATGVSINLVAQSQFTSPPGFHIDGRDVVTDPWRPNGGDSGTLVMGTPGSTVNIRFKDVAFFDTPDPISITFPADNSVINRVDVVYILQDAGLITVTILPPGAIASGAQWRIIGLEVCGFPICGWHDSGETIGVTQNSVGYVIEFKDIPGWTTPENAEPVIVISDPAVGREEFFRTGIYVASGDPVGAACDATNGVCTITTEADAIAGGLIYQGDGTTCTPNPCPIPPEAPIGACCNDFSGSCIETTEATCPPGSTYQGDLTTCTPNPCTAIPPPDDDGDDFVAFDDTEWNLPTDWTDQGLDVVGGLTTSITKGDCESHDNPDVAILQSGQSIIAYDARNEKGNTRISLALVDTSVKNRVIYYRSLSFGTLLNSDITDITPASFEVFDDVTISLNGVIPVALTSIGFLTGPLKGQQPFLVTSITRSENEAGRPKNVITFETVGRQAVFPDSNHVSNVSWFLIEGTSGSPGGFSLLDLPVHSFENKQVPVAHPSVSVAKNHLMGGTDQHVFVAYQAFENKKWRVYLRHIVLSEKPDIAPEYLEPYIFQAPTTMPDEVVSAGITELIYTVKSLGNKPGVICALFDVKLETGQQVTNCNTDAGSFVTDCNFSVTGVDGLLTTNAYLEVQFDLTTCGPSTPSWSVGIEYTGGVLPTADEIGWTGDPSCITSIPYPNQIEWCYPKASCIQRFLIDDPYCPDAYTDVVDVVYRPEDLYLMEDNDQVVSRVKYNMSASIKDREDSAVDIMFIVDYSGSMGDNIDKIRQSLVLLSQQLQRDGVDVRFGFAVYGQGYRGNTPRLHDRFLPVRHWHCQGPTDDTGRPYSPHVGPGHYLYDGLQSGECTSTCLLTETGNSIGNFSGATGGFTRDVNVLKNALCCRSITGSLEPHWVAIQFAAGVLPAGETDVIFDWNENAQKLMILVTDEAPGRPITSGAQNAPPFGSCLGYNNDKDEAIATLISNGISFIPIVDTQFAEFYDDIPAQTGWSGPSSFDIRSESYDEIFTIISSSIKLFVTPGLRLLERDNGGYKASFMKDAEVLITYNGDLSDLWTYNKTDLIFSDRPPLLTGDSKGLTKMPSSLYKSKIYGIDPVQVLGNIDNWVYYIETGVFRTKYPNIGFIAPIRTDPILISDNGTKPKVLVNNRNDILVAYQSYELGYPQIEIKGTGDFHQNSITGPKAKRITRLITESDFIFNHSVTLPGDLLNQLADVVIDNSDITHITWQSNKGSRWEIYYANSYNVFLPIKITDSDSRSGFPKIDIDVSGNIFIVYHDNRFGPYEIMMSFKEEDRILPLLEQDAYMASLRASYQHFTNTLPILLRNVVTITPDKGVLVTSKIASIEGNGDENFVFVLDENLAPRGGGNAGEHEIIAMAGNTEGFMYGITKSNKILLIDEPEFEDPYLDIEVSEIKVLANLDVATPIPGSILIEDTFSSASGTSFPTSDWTQFASNFGGFVTASGIICSDSMSICSSCSQAQSEDCGSIPMGFYVHNTRIVTGDRNITARYRLRWNYTGVLPLTTNNMSFVLLLRTQNTQTSSGSPTPSYGVALTMQNGWVALITRKQANSTVTLATAVLNTNILQNRWANIQVDCFDEGGSVKIRLFVDGVLALSATDSGQTAFGAPLVSDASGAFSYGFQSNADTGGAIASHILLDSYSIETISESLSVVNILDAAHDQSNKLWLLTTDVDSDGVSSQRLLEISKTSGSSLISGIVSQNIDRSSGGVAILLDGTFFVVTHVGGKAILQKSSYPVFGTIAEFSFVLITDTLSANIIALTSDNRDNLFGLDETNLLYSVDKITGELTQLADLTSDPYSDDPYVGPNPIAQLSSLAYLFTGKNTKLGSEGFFHVMIEFYDNINLQGDPALVIDSRDNLEAFLVPVNSESEDPYFEGAKGIFLADNETIFAFFDASHFRPGQENLSYPYSFATNQTYFPRVFMINSSGALIIITDVTELSFSCNKCTTIGNNIFDSHGCSYTFTAEHNGHVRVYKFVVDFFADKQRKHLIQRYIIDSNSADINLVEINNDPASEDASVTSDGITIADGEIPVIQLYPALDPNTGIICGIDYTVAVYVCVNSDCTEVDKNPGGNLTIKAEKTFRCECSSNIFSDKLIALSQVGIWRSSGQGFSDTRVTDSHKDSMRPAISTRISGSSIIVFEDYNAEDVAIKGATFTESDQDELFGSGTRSWFDYDLKVVGRDISLATDLYDRAVTAFEIPSETAGRGLSVNELPSTTVAVRNSDFEKPRSTTDMKGTCDISSLTSNIISSDPFVAKSLVKKILLKPVKYYTYNSDGETTPVVDTCNIVLQIWATPEVVALRFRNENENVYSQWCPFSPEISDYNIEKQWRLSGGIGIKEICVQAMTYAGLTAQFCVPVIGDYVQVSYQISLYKDELFEKELPKSDGLFVASTKNIETGLPQSLRTIWVKIIPSINVETDIINFDVVQQGDGDILNIVADKFIESGGRMTYRGKFDVKTEDNVFNIDGLAKIIAKFPGECEEFDSIVVGNIFSKDKFNIVTEGLSGQVVDPSDAATDPLDSSRQQISGRIGVPIVVRPTSDDPFLIFGDPSFYTEVDAPDTSKLGVRQKNASVFVGEPPIGTSTPGATGATGATGPVEPGSPSGGIGG